MSQTLTENQLELLRVLWDRGEATVVDVHEELSRQRDVAPATVATMLNRLCDDGVLERVRVGRQYVYRALVAKDAVRRSMLGSVMERLFGGDSAALLSHLVRENKVTADDLEQAKALLERDESSKPMTSESRAGKRRRKKS